MVEVSGVAGDGADTPVRRLRVPINRLGGTFMMGAEMGKIAAQIGVPVPALYFRGRSGPLGDLTPTAIRSIFAIFPDHVVSIVQSAKAIKPSEAAELFTTGCVQWGQTHLRAAPGLRELTALLTRIIEGADSESMVLANTWRKRPHPNTTDEGKAAYALFLVREIRGAQHFAALTAVGLPVRLAVLADPEGGVGRLQRTGWRQEQIDELETEGRRRGDVPETWARAEYLTESAFGGLLHHVLGADEQWRLVELVEAAAWAAFHDTG